MFRMSTFTEHIGEILTIKIKKKYKKEHQLELFSTGKPVINNPFNDPFGLIVDVNGNKWECGGMTQDCILARPYVIDYWNDTSLTYYPGMQTKTLIPYKIEMVD